MLKSRLILFIAVSTLVITTLIPAQAAEAFRGTFTRERTIVGSSSGDTSESPTTPPSSPAPSPSQPAPDSGQDNTSSPRFSSPTRSSYSPAPAPSTPPPAPEPSPSPPAESQPSQPAPVPQAPSWLTSSEAQAFQLLNEFRANNGLPPVQISHQLVQMARAKAQDMIDHNYFAHHSPTYGSVGSMFRTFGISYTYGAENLARAASVYRAQLLLQNSSGHRRNMLDSNFNQVGIAVLPLTSTPGVVLVQVFTD